MRPDENNNRRNQTPLVPQRSILDHQAQSKSNQNRPDHNQAAGNIVRQQIDRIYENSLQPETDAATSSQSTEAPDSPYERTQTNPATIQTDHWKKYHSAWQDYYQKYYERYYVGQVYRTQQALEERARDAKGPAPASGPAPNPAPTQPEEAAGIDRSQAMYELRSRLQTKLTSSVKKVRRSRHFVPISAAACVVVLFLFLQYNRVLFANVEAYISPGNIDPANIIIDPTQTAAVSDEPQLIIPKINVDVPVVYDVTPDHESQMTAMQDGVAWFGIPGANSKPGQVGNTVLSGHSSNDIIDSGDYKFIFARLDQLKEGDTIFANYEGKRYTYSVTKKEVVKPSQVGKLVYDTDKPVLTLITCTPLGTALNRLLVTAEQISPSPNQAAPAPDSNSQNNQPIDMPGNSPTLLERIF